MKNIILISRQKPFCDMTRKLVKQIMDNKKYRIIVLIVNSKEEKNFYTNHYDIENVYSFLEVEQMESTDFLDYTSMHQYKATQLEVENYFCREYNDYQLNKYYYYMGLNFWLSIFKEYDINLVINLVIKHGRTYESIPNDIAVYRGISTYFFSDIGYNDCYFITDGFRKITSFFNTEKIDSIDYLLKSNYDKTELAPSKIKKGLIQRFFYKLGGNLLEDFFYRVIRWNWKPRAIGRGVIYATFGQKLFGYFNLKLTEQFLDRISCSYNEKDKYVYYSLHFEPEATIHVRTVLESQLVVIRILAEALPKGWVLYVKEHPAQFSVNNDSGYFYMIQAKRFKNKAFYEKIQSMSNVKLIKKETSSQLLIENSMAVASIVGTVLLEGVKAKKPILLFSDMHPLYYAKEIFVIKSFDDCKKALMLIKDGFSPNYNTVIEDLQPYIFKGKYMVVNLLNLISRL